MTAAAPSLSESLAALRATLVAAPAPAWLPNTVHALILACFVRVFARLEKMVALWQAGLLPPPARPAPRPQSPRAIPKPPTFFARIAAFFAAPPAPAYPAARRVAPAPRTRIDAPEGCRQESKQAATKTQRHKEESEAKAAPMQPPLPALALSSFFVPLCLSGRLLSCCGTLPPPPDSKSSPQPPTPLHALIVTI
jgi:hypothetical protein